MEQSVPLSQQQRRLKTQMQNCAPALRVGLQRQSQAELHHCPELLVSSRRQSAWALAAEAVEMMQRHSINGLFAVDSAGRPAGALNALDLIRAGVF